MTEAREGCRQVQDRFSELLENDLSADARRDMEAHLSGCEECQAAYARFRETIAALASLPRARPPEDLPGRIDRAIDRAGKSKPSRPRARMLRHAMAAVFVAAIVGGIIRVVPEATRPFPAGDERIAREVSRPKREDTDRLGRSEPSPPVALKQKGLGAIAEVDSRAAPEEEARLQEKAQPEANVATVGRKRATGEARPARRGVLLSKSGVVAGYVAPGDPDAPRALLLSVRGDEAWVAAIRNLAQRHPGRLAAAWESLGEDEQGRVLDAWRRAAPTADLESDLARAQSGARGDREKKVIELFRSAAPAKAP